jgi:2'-5' RNA ligase
MAERGYSHVAATFTESDIKPFQKLTRSITKREDFCYSDTIDYVRGDVSSKLHMTIFYGLVDEKIDKTEMNAFISNLIMPEVLVLGGLTVRKEYNGFCQILWVDVLDSNGMLRKISESFKRFPFEESVQLGFIPHFTLAYIRNGYQLPDEIPDYSKEIKIERIKYFEK